MNAARAFLSTSTRSAVTAPAWKNASATLTKTAPTWDQAPKKLIRTRSDPSLLTAPIKPPITVPAIPKRPIHTQSRTDRDLKKSAETLELDLSKGVKHFMHPHLPRLDNGPVDKYATHIVAVNAADAEQRSRQASANDARRVLFVHGGDPKKKGMSPSEAARAFKASNPGKLVGLVVNPHLPPEQFKQEVADKGHADFLHTEPIGNVSNLHPDNRAILEQYGRTGELHVGVNNPGVYKSLAEHTENVDPATGGHAPDPQGVMSWALQHKIHTYSQAVAANQDLVSEKYVKQQAELNRLRNSVDDD